MNDPENDTPFGANWFDLVAVLERMGLEPLPRNHLFNIDNDEEPVAESEVETS